MPYYIAPKLATSFASDVKYLMLKYLIPTLGLNEVNN